MDPYQPCPCGSGKNFKWCCQSFYATVEKARHQHEQGQHETALQTIKQLVEQHPGNASVLGYQAELLYMNGKPEEADEAIQKAFAINPDFPLGHFLRGILRKDEGEFVGALIQFRKAAELYDPKANQILAEIYAFIFDIEMRLNRPVAARAALERAIHGDPATEELRQAFETIFIADSRMPECARKEYVFRAADPKRAESWKSVLGQSQSGRPSQAAIAFEKLAEQDANDASAWFNLGLVKAWLGEHPPAIEALRKSVESENDPARVAEAGALIEVLCCGHGMEEQSDHLEHRAYFRLQQSEPLVQLLEEWQRNNRLSGARSDQEKGVFSAMVLEETPQFGIETTVSLAKLGCYLMIVQDIVRLWSPSQQGVAKVADEIKRKLGPAVSVPTEETGFALFSDIAVEAMLFPVRETTIDQIAQKLQDHAIAFFEDVWVHRPLKALAGVSPLDAASHPAYQKKLPGVVQFMEECYIASSPRVGDGEKIQIVVLYDFDRLRRKLGLPTKGTNVPAPAVDDGPKFDELSTAELAGLKTEELNDVQLDRAFRAAVKLDARDVAGKFANDLVNRSTVANRFPYFNHLIQMAQSENDGDAVLALLDRGEKADAETNNGERHNDYALRRGQALAKKGEVERAHEVFQALLAKSPDELKFYGSATETMLGQKHGPWALQFAEQGLAKARGQNNRDSEQYFMELVEAAKRLG